MSYLNLFLQAFHLLQAAVEQPLRTGGFPAAVRRKSSHIHLIYVYSIVE